MAPTKDGDGAVAVLELSEYVRERYRIAVKRKESDDYVRLDQAR